MINAFSFTLRNIPIKSLVYILECPKRHTRVDLPNGSFDVVYKSSEVFHLRYHSIENNSGFFNGLLVTSREVVWLFFEQLRSEFVPVLHRLQGRSGCQC